VYVFRDEAGRPLYVGKSVSLRTRARAHFCAPAGWTERAEVVDYVPTSSELGALVLENRLIKRLRPAGNVKLKRTDGHRALRRRRRRRRAPAGAPRPADARGGRCPPLRARGRAASAPRATRGAGRPPLRPAPGDSRENPSGGGAASGQAPVRRVLDRRGPRC